MSQNTLRLLMPQWQGGNNPPYGFGARLLRWLAPEADGMPEIEVPVEPFDGTELPLEDGVRGRTVLMRQLRCCTNIIQEYQPDRIILFGGDCLVSQAPFAYLNEKYSGELGVLWIDAHPDISTPAMHKHVHAMVLGNLLGEGDPGFAAQVKRHVHPENVMYAGLQQLSTAEEAVVNRLDLRRAGPRDVAENSSPVLRFLEERGIRHLAIHLDLDVLDPQLFRSQLFNNPNDPTPINSFSGKMSFPLVTRLINDVERETRVVGMSYAEHMPWDDINLKNMMQQFGFMK